MNKYITGSILFLSDLIFLVAIYLLVGWLRHFVERFGLPSFVLYQQQELILILGLILLILWYEKIYSYRFDFWEETKLLLKALSLSFMIILAFLVLSRIETLFSRTFIVMYFILLALLFPFYKRFCKRILYSFVRLRKKVKIIGNQEQYALLKKEFRQNWYLGLEYSEHDYNAVFITTKNMPLDELDKHLNHYMQETKDIYVLPYAEKINFSKANMLEYFNIRTSVFHIENELLKPHNLFIKDIFEKVCIIIIFPFFLILHGIIAFIIKKDSKGAVLFKQQRLGKNNQPFECLKYRTMYEDGESLLRDYLTRFPDEVTYYEQYHKYKNDPRITKIGKFLRRSSLDELPQIINILKGDMSLVGPRPYMVEERKKLGSHIDIILLVKPGITGLWQVSGRNSLTFKNRIELDMWYIQNWSLWTDFVILVKTIKVVLMKKGAQ